MNTIPGGIYTVMQSYIQLAKLKITIAVAISTFLGFVLAQGVISINVVRPVAGIFLLACASAALNQVQERDIDKLMPRTASRPLPSGKIGVVHALIFCCILAFSGLWILFEVKGLLLSLLGLLAMVLYNGVYTPLKRRTAFAVIPGSLIGAIPPLCGWVAAGAYVFDLQIILIAFFFVMWQIPHFWLLLLKNGSQYSKAGLPVLTNIFDNESLGRITFVWIMMSVASALFISYFGFLYSTGLRIALLITSLSLVAYCSPLVTHPGRPVSRKYFIAINIYLLCVMLIVILNAFIK